MIRNIIDDPVIRRLVVLFVVTRLALLAAGLAGHAVLPPGKAVVGENLSLERQVPVALDIWARWDSEWYLLIAERGYDASGEFSNVPVGYRPEDTTGFFPLYPLLIRALAPLFGWVGAGIIVSNLALFAAVLLLPAVARNLWGQGFGGRAGLGAGIALLFFPFTLFHSAVYSESLFLALSLATFLLVRQDCFGWAALSAGLATLTRPFGALLVILLLMEWWRRRHSTRWGWAAIGGVALALGLYMLFCYGLFGDALAFIHRQGRWRGAMVFPGYALIRWWQAGPTIHGAHGSGIEMVMAILYLGALPAAFRRLRPSLAWYLAACVAVPLSSTLWSFGRIASTFFPIYLLIGMVWAEERPTLLRFWVGMGGAGAMVAMAYFAAGWWVG